MEKPPGTADAARVRLSGLGLETGDEFLYTYDFGDDWEHSVVVEGAEDADPVAMHPRCLGGERACPQEDCGGIHMYGQLLHELTLPPREQNRELVDWLPPDFDPERFDVDRANERLRSIRPRS